MTRSCLLHPTFYRMCYIIENNSWLFIINYYYHWCCYYIAAVIIIELVNHDYYSSTKKSLSDHSCNTRFSKTNLPVSFFGTTAGQQTTHYRESALLKNGLKADLKDLSGSGAFRAAVRRCLLAGEL